MRKRESVFRGKTRSTKANRRDRDKHPHRARKRETKHRGKTRQNRNRARHFQTGARHFRIGARQFENPPRHFTRRARQFTQRPRRGSLRPLRFARALDLRSARLPYDSARAPHLRRIFGGLGGLGVAWQRGLSTAGLKQLNERGGSGDATTRGRVGYGGARRIAGRWRGW